MALSRATRFAGVQILANDYEDKQLVTAHCETSTQTNIQIHTLNIVDRDLLKTAGLEIVDLPTTSGRTSCDESRATSGYKTTASCANTRIASTLTDAAAQNTCVDVPTTADQSCVAHTSDIGEAPLDRHEKSLLHPVSQLRALCTIDEDCLHRPRVCLDAHFSSSWGDRYFESQVLARCGLHALNNLVGGPQFIPLDLETACAQVCAETDECLSDHAHNDGWYSHSVLARVLQNTVPPRWRLELQALSLRDLQAFFQNPLIYGALINEHDSHWTALVKHAGFVWYVDSKDTPIVLSEAALVSKIEEFPNSYALVDNDF